MTQAEQEQKAFFCEALDVELQHTDQPEFPSLMASLAKLCSIISLNFVPLAIVGGLSRFQAGNSTQLQRGFAMSWLVCGAWYGLIKQITAGLVFAHPKDDPRSTAEAKPLTFEDFSVEPAAPDFVIFLYILLCCPFVVGGMVVAGLMMRDYGVCTLIG